MRSLRKKFLCMLSGLLLIIFAALLFSGCTAGAQSDNANNDAASPEVTEENSSESDEAIGTNESSGESSMPDWLKLELVEGRTLDEIKNISGGLWVQRDDRYLSLELIDLREERWWKDPETGTYYDYCVVSSYALPGDLGENGLYAARDQAEMKRNVEYAPVLRLSEGDVLVTTRNLNSVSFAPVVSYEGYIYDDGHTISKGKDSIDYYEEIDGQEIKDNEEARLAVLEGLGVRYDDTIGDYVADVPTSITGGYYSGTDWKTEAISFDQQIFISQSSPKIELSDITKTKEGYFIIDTSELRAGAYVVDGNHYVVVE